jgi:hypothetical protein
VTVNVAGEPSVTLALAGVALPLAQARDTVTAAPLLGTKSLLTWKVSVFSVFVIVQTPALNVAMHVPEEPYPDGIGDSVAVQFGSPEKPVTVKTAGVASEALAEAGLALPLAQESDTVTLAALFGTKSLFTWKVSDVMVFVIVQTPALSVATQVALEV